ncbi:MAG: hypothetical protein WCP21_09255, partial [Armatimonadota bacterium]
NQGAHIEDLISRFANEALGDTLHRVGRDLQRKLSREDRVIGPLLMDLQQGVQPEITALCAAAGLHFRAPDEHGQLFPADEQFLDEVVPKGLDVVLRGVCGLDASQPLDAQAIGLIKQAERDISARTR